MKQAGAVLGLIACNAFVSVADGGAGPPPCAKTYLVKAVTLPEPRIDGVFGEDEWPAERWNSDMTFPWRDEPAPTTAFAFQADDQALYFAFRVVDENVVIVEGAPGDERLVARGDRVEMFFAQDPELKEYYSLEIDPRGRVLDYQGSFYRRFDNDWDLPGLDVATRQRTDGYDVEGRLSPRALQSMGVDVWSVHPLLVGVYRGEFSRRASGEIDESWISWVRPDAEEPDFHIPSSFGCLRFDMVH